MHFLNPLFLVGLLAASLPIIIHLINRQKAVRRRFPAMEFLRRSQQKLARRLKVRHLLLLALRVLALLLVALGLARPYLVSDAGVEAGDRLPRGVVFVVDDSASMAWDDGAAWREAVGRVGEEVGRLRAWDRVSLVYGSAWPAGAPLGEDIPLPQLVDDHGEVLEALEGHAPTMQGTDLGTALRSASAMLATSDLPAREIVLVTDRQRSGLDLEALAKVPLEVPVRVLDVGGEEARSNLAVVGASYQQRSTGAKPEFEVVATVQSFGAEAASGVEVQLVVDGVQVASGLVDVPAGGKASKVFTTQLERRGVHRAEFRLAEGTDRLLADNVYAFPIHLAAKVRALIVNGDRRTVAYQDEVFYLERALQPGPRSSSAVVFDTVGVDGLEGKALSDYDVVVLANAEKVPRASVTELRAFVEGGGGLLLTVGDQVKPEGWNPLFGELLPRQLRSTKVLAGQDDPDAPIKLVRLGSPDRTHPVFRVFDLPGGESLGSVRVYSYMLLDPNPVDATQIVLSYSDGAPALLERPLGEGRVALLTTTLDRDWTDLPIRTAFLPMMQRYLRYLARRGTSAGEVSPYVASRVSLEVPADKRARVEVRDPDGGRIVLAPESTDPNAPLTFVPRRAGAYSVWAAPRSGDGAPVELEELAFAVNLDPAESDLTPLPLEELTPLLSPQREGGEAPVLDTPERRLGLWSLLLFLVTLALLGETVLGTRRSVLLKVWGRVRGAASAPKR